MSSNVYIHCGMEGETATKQKRGGRGIELCTEKIEHPAPAFHFNKSFTNRCDLWTLRKQKFGYQSKSGKEALLPTINMPIPRCVANANKPRSHFSNFTSEPKLGFMDRKEERREEKRKDR